MAAKHCLTALACSMAAMTAHAEPSPVYFGAPPTDDRPSHYVAVSPGNLSFKDLVSGTDGTLAPSGGRKEAKTSAAAPSSVPTPQPGTYALMLAGLAAVGFVARRRGGA